MFDDIAPGYDAFNHIGSMGADRCWRRKALRALDAPANESEGGIRILDIACGTGDFSIAAARRLNAEVVGVDISEGMLEVMRRKVEKEGLQERIKAEPGDAAALQYPDGSFDAVTVAFGVRNFEDRPRCLQEILRVLKPGGKFVMLELGVPSWQPAKWLYITYSTRILPWLGRRISGNRGAYEYLPASVLNFPGKMEWLATMDAAGFKGCRHRALSFGICRLYIAEKEKDES